MSPYKFLICDTTGEELSSYSGGGVVCQVKTPKTLKFVSTVIAHLAGYCKWNFGDLKLYSGCNCSTKVMGLTLAV